MTSKIKATALLFTFGWSMYAAFELSGLSMMEMTQLDADVLDTQYRNCGNQIENVCDKLEYVSRLNNRWKRPTQETEKNRRIHEIKSLDNATEYQNVFENYILKNRYYM